MLKHNYLNTLCSVKYHMVAVKAKSHTIGGTVGADNSGAIF